MTQSQSANQPNPSDANKAATQKGLKGYAIKGKLGKGGMASVYLAIQESFGREVAIKVMSPSLAAKKDFAVRFALEAKLVSQLSHPNIVTVYDVGQQGKYAYLAMEYHPGGHLGQLIRAGLSTKEALSFAAQIADGLGAAHEAGIVHRDLKPDNILISKRGTPVISDFGIARDNNVDTNLTQIGSTVGTPKYMSPEQARGQRVDGRSDLYGLGVILFEMLTGEPPFQADDPVALAIKHCKDPIPRLPKPLMRFQPLIDKLMNKEAAHRPANAAEVLKLIQELQKPEVKTQPASELVRPKASRPDGYKTLNTKPAKSQPELPKQKLFEIDDVVSGGFLTKKVTREVVCRAKDYKQFEQIFVEVSRELSEWLDAYGKKAVQLDFVIEAHPWIHRRILDKLNSPYSPEHPYGKFAQQGTITVHLFDEVDREGERYLLREKGKIPQ